MKRIISLLFVLMFINNIADAQFRVRKSGGIRILQSNSQVVGDMQSPSSFTLSTGTITSSSIALTWTTPTDNVGVTSYEVYLGGGLVTTVGTTTYNVTSLEPSTEYSFYVKAKDAAGNSTNSNTITPSTISDIAGEDPPAQDDGTASGVATYQSIGLYWSGHSSGGSACTVKYRVAGSGSQWTTGQNLWYDTRSVGGRPANEYRGSIVGLNDSTNYEIWLTAGTKNNSFTVQTWDDSPPEGTVVNVSNSSSTLNITTSGTANGWRVYQPAGWSEADPWNNMVTIDVNNLSNNCIFINAQYVIIRGFILLDAGEDAIKFATDAGQTSNDVKIQYCEISNWGFVGMGSNNQAGVRAAGTDYNSGYNATNVKRITIERCKIHDSRDNGQGWDAGSRHPTGPNGINFGMTGGNHVFRYNDIYNTVSGKKFMDGIGGGDNFTNTGSPGRDSDIYGNKISEVFDDAIEAEGGGMNVRVWGNWMSNIHIGVANATVAIGPMYIFRNISNVGQRLHDASFTPTSGQNNGEDRGPFNKSGTGDASFIGGRTYLYHNTVLQPSQGGFTNPRGLAGLTSDQGGSPGVRQVVSANNIAQSSVTSQGLECIVYFQGGSTGQNCSFTNELCDFNPSGGVGSASLTGIIIGKPVYTVSLTTSSTPNASGYFLANGSPGKAAGISLPGFNSGSNVDVGAYQNGQSVLQFGVNAYK